MSTIPLWCRPGVEVECIDDSVPPGSVLPSESFVVKGIVYTIRRVADFGAFGIVLYLVEIVNPATMTVCGLMERGFEVERFKPVTKRTAEQDIAEHFADLLKVGAPERVGETA